MAITVRPIEPTEAPSIMGVMDSAFLKEFGEAWTLDQCLSTLSLPGSALIGAYNDTTLMGFALYLTVMDTSELLLLAVDPIYGRRGIGTLLLNQWQADMRRSRCKLLFLEVRENNSALSFYRHQGFEIIGQRPNYYKVKDGKHLAALTMNKIV